jgi:hypothetical protein
MFNTAAATYGLHDYAAQRVTDPDDLVLLFTFSLSSHDHDVVLTDSVMHVMHQLQHVVCVIESSSLPSILKRNTSIISIDPYAGVCSII